MLESSTKTLPNGIFLRHWDVVDPIGVVVSVHGMGTHSGRFEKMAEGLAKVGLMSYAYDHPGHGRSPGKRGHFNSYDDLLNALDSVVNYAKTKQSDLPVFIFGHSMGGNVVANYVIRRKPEVTGVVLSSPWLKLAFSPPFFKMMLARAVVNIWPGLTQNSKLNVNYISHDPDILKAYDNDPLVHAQITPRFFLETSKAGLYALEHADEFDLPLYLYHGTDDHVTSFPASVQFAQKISNCTFTRWEGCYHEVHHEWVYPQLMESILSFVRSYVPKRNEDDYTLPAAG